VNGRTSRAVRKALPEDTRRHNRSVVLQSLFRDGPQSRADLVRVTGLTAPTVSDLVAELTAEQLLEEVGRRAPAVGKPATLVGIDPGGRHLVCLDLAQEDRFHGAVVDLSGKVVTRRAVAVKGRTGAAAADSVLKLADDLVRATDRPVLGVGVGSPGVVDRDGVVLNAANLHWTDVPLASLLSERLGLPVHVANDANAAALSELTFGTGSAPNLLLVKIGRGVGAGLLVDGRVVVGDRSAAGEIGHVVVDERGEPCACGQRGCLETAIAAPLLRARLAAATSPRARAAAIESAGRRLGLALAPVVSVLNLHDVVVSGPSDVVAEPLLDAALATIRRRTMTSVGDNVTIRTGTLGDDDVLLGAAVLVLDQELGVA
jgi:predicted NBD/HSP70 family sugar kinase